MSGFASRQGEARSAYVSPYPFEPTNGGLGIALACTTSSTSAALVGEGQTLIVTNTGSVEAYLALGEDDVVATTSYIPILPGTQVTLSVPIQPDVDSITHAAGVTAADATTLQITRGYGI